MKTKEYQRKNGFIEIDIDTYTRNGDIIGDIYINCMCGKDRLISGEHKRHGTIYCKCGQRFSY